MNWQINQVKGLIGNEKWRVLSAENLFCYSGIDRLPRWRLSIKTLKKRKYPTDFKPFSQREDFRTPRLKSNKTAS